MAVSEDTEDENAVSRMRSVNIDLSPLSRFPVPKSNGYSVYAALLSVLSDVDETVSARIHESPLGSLHSSGLLGHFAGSDRAHHKTVLPGETYELSLGIVHSDDTAVFQALVNAVVLSSETVELSRLFQELARVSVENVDLGEIHYESTKDTLRTHLSL
jgi:CRISPR-associated endoribonuclease Cas6